MNRYDICQQMKNRTEVSVENLKLSEVSEKLWTYLPIDFITKLLLVVGKNAILVVYNRLSKMTHFIATTEETLVEELVWLFGDNIWKLYELLKSIISDRGLYFVVNLTKKLNNMLEIEIKLSMSFHSKKTKQSR